MYENRSFSDKTWLVLKGLGMGAANKVPGVSGGVVAFVAGFYEEFIYSLQKVNKKAFLLLINGRDRKSTRLNSSHVRISYAVFCLKKKTNTNKKRTNIKHDIQTHTHKTVYI